ncbi:MAG: hypothetical protein IKQ91_03505 [Oscillospiraceae bacterium]|nr:hypothetical protein [Oscillospiraceae bacterium]
MERNAGYRIHDAYVNREPTQHPCTDKEMDTACLTELLYNLLFGDQAEIDKARKQAVHLEAIWTRYRNMLCDALQKKHQISVQESNNPDLLHCGGRDYLFHCTRRCLVCLKQTAEGVQYADPEQPEEKAIMEQFGENHQMFLAFCTDGTYLYALDEYGMLTTNNPDMQTEQVFDPQAEFAALPQEIAPELLASELQLIKERKGIFRWSAGDEHKACYDSDEQVWVSLCVSGSAHTGYMFSISQTTGESIMKSYLSNNTIGTALDFFRHGYIPLETLLLLLPENAENRKHYDPRQKKEFETYYQASHWFTEI